MVLVRVVAAARAWYPIVCTQRIMNASLAERKVRMSRNRDHDRNENEPTSREPGSKGSLVRTLNEKGASVQFETRTWPLASIHSVIRQLCDIYNLRAQLNTDDDEGIRENLVTVSTSTLVEEILARFDNCVIAGRKHMRSDTDGNIHAYYRRWAGDREVCTGLAAGMQHELHLNYDAERDVGGEV